MTAVNHPLKILFLSANPQTTNRLRLDAEVRQIAEKIRGATHGDAINLIARWAVRPEDLQQVLLEVAPHIVHFSGHGTRGESIVLEDESGEATLVRKEALGGLFRILKDNVRVVFLNACYSRPQAEAIVEHIDCAIGMRNAVPDETAIAFAAAFYRAVAFGRSIREAFDLGTNAVGLEDIEGADIPDLLMREGVDPGRITLVAPTHRRVSVLVALGPLLVGAGVGLHQFMGAKAPPSGLGERPGEVGRASSASTVALDAASEAVAPSPAPERAQASTMEKVPALAARPMSLGLLTRPQRSAALVEPRASAAASAPVAPAPMPSSPDMTVVRTGNLTAGQEGQIRAGNRAGGGSTDVETQNVTAGDGGKAAIGNVTGRASSGKGTHIWVKTDDVRVGDGGTIDIGNKQ